jgi:hypothetical protein
MLWLVVESQQPLFEQKASALGQLLQPSLWVIFSQILDMDKNFSGTKHTSFLLSLGS